MHKTISDIIRKFDLSYHSYADNAQLYVSINNHSNTLAGVENCVHEINMLKLNDDNR